MDALYVDDAYCALPGKLAVNSCDSLVKYVARNVNALEPLFDEVAVVHTYRQKN